MNSIILSVAARVAVPLLLVFSVFSFLRGHDEPGGGFIGGLIAAAAVSLWVLADGIEAVKERLRIEPHGLMAIGLLVSVASTLVGPLQGRAPLAGVWVTIATPLGTGKLGTPLLFDLGVYLVVVGAVLTMVFSLEEAAPR